MNILMITRASPITTRAGTEIFVRRLSFEMAKRGHEVHLLYGETTASWEVADGTLAPRNVHLHRITYPNILFFGGLVFSVKLIFFLRHILSNLNFDVVECFGAPLGYVFPFLGKKTANVYCALDCMASEYTFRRRTAASVRPALLIKDAVKYGVLIMFERLACRRAATIIAISKDTAREIVESYRIRSEKVQVVYLPVPMDFSKDYETIYPESPVFLHMATDHLRRGTSFLLESFKSARDKFGLKCKLIITGEKEQFYIDLAKEYGLDAEFVGWVTESKLKELFSACTCLVIPSVREGFCLPVIEAGMFGKPTIATRSGSLPELVNDGVDGFLVDFDDTTALARKLWLMSKDRKLQIKLGEAAKIKAQHFSSSKTAENSLNVFSTLLKTNA